MSRPSCPSVKLWLAGDSSSVDDDAFICIDLDASPTAATVSSPRPLNGVRSASAASSSSRQHDQHQQRSPGVHTERQQMPGRHASSPSCLHCQSGNSLRRHSFDSAVRAYGSSAAAAVPAPLRSERRLKVLPSTRTSCQFLFPPIDERCASTTQSGVVEASRRRQSSWSCGSNQSSLSMSSCRRASTSHTSDSSSQPASLLWSASSRSCSRRTSGESGLSGQLVLSPCRGASVDVQRRSHSGQDALLLARRCSCCNQYSEQLLAVHGGNCSEREMRLAAGRPASFCCARNTEDWIPRAASRSDRLTFTQQLAFPTLAGADTSRFKRRDHFRETEAKMNMMAKLITIVILSLTLVLIVGVAYNCSE